MFEGLGPSAHSAHTQFYNIEAFSSQKGDKMFIFLNFPRFPPNFREKIMTRKNYWIINFGKPGKRPRAHFRNYGRNPALSGQSGPISPGKKSFCMK